MPTAVLWEVTFYYLNDNNKDQKQYKSVVEGLWGSVQEENSADNLKILIYEQDACCQCLFARACKVN